jgi:hypothetical protein
MRMGTSWRKDKDGMGVVSAAFPVPTEPVVSTVLSVLNSILNKGAFDRNCPPARGCL